MKFSARKCEPEGPDRGSNAGAMISWDGGIIIQVGSYFRDLNCIWWLNHIVYNTNYVF